MPDERANFLSQATVSRIIERVAMWLGSNQYAIAGTVGTKNSEEPNVNVLPGPNSWQAAGSDANNDSKLRNFSLRSSVAVTKYGTSKRDEITRLILQAMGSTSIPIAFRFDKTDSSNGCTRTHERI